MIDFNKELCTIIAMFTTSSIQLTTLIYSIRKDKSLKEEAQFCSFNNIIVELLSIVKILIYKLAFKENNLETYIERFLQITEELMISPKVPRKMKDDIAYIAKSIQSDILWIFELYKLGDISEKDKHVMFANNHLKDIVEEVKNKINIDYEYSEAELKTLICGAYSIQVKKYNVELIKKIEGIAANIDSFPNMLTYVIEGKE